MIDSLRFRSYEQDIEKFCGLLEPNPKAILLDLGCGKGAKTLRFSASVGTSKVVGLDIQNVKAPFWLTKGNIDLGLPFKSGSLDVVTSYHTIEHISNTDLFVTEVYRILKTGGYTTIATPNLASAQVILDLILNRQPGTLHVSDFFIPRGDPGNCWKESIGFLHRRLFTLEGISKLLTNYGFKIEYARGSGYGAYYLLGKLLRGRYAADIIVKARK